MYNKISNINNCINYNQIYHFQVIENSPVQISGNEKATGCSTLIFTLIYLFYKRIA